jgi:hypothetical protein
MSRFEHRRKSIVVVVAIAAGVLAGTAVAFLTSSGNGAGGAAAGNAAAASLSPGTTTAALVPGGSADVGVSIVNGNPSRIFVGSLSLDAAQGTNGFAVDGTHSACNLGSLSFTTQTNGGAGWFVPGNSTSVLDLGGAVSLSTAAVSACQGAQVTVYLQAGP